MAVPNFTDKTIWTGDNLDVLRGLNSETVDLIYLDPPFNSNRDYAAPVGSQAAGAAFKDTWTLSDLDEAWMGLIADERPAIAYMLDAARQAHGKGMQSYLTMMAVRLLEMRRVLKETGSIYLHCDPTASHYLKALMDAILGHANFRNEIIWRRAVAKGNSSIRLARNHDVILSYGASQYARVEAFVPYDFDNLADKTKEQYRLVDSNGRRYQRTSLINPNKDRPNLTYEFLGVRRVWRWTKERMQREYDAGNIIQTRSGGVPRFKRYLDNQRGMPLDDIWADIPAVSGDEDIGYPTQKPLKLLERIIAASSNVGDVVLDPFCGCATACVAAERLGRQWLGIDISPKAVELVNERLQGAIGDLFHNRLVTARTDIPRRTDVDAPKNYRQNKHVLYGQQEGRCGGCRMDFPFKIFEVDHVIPSSKGGTAHIENLQLLCGHCNRIKGDREQSYLMARLKEVSV